jgi:hypothetical protein
VVTANARPKTIIVEKPLSRAKRPSSLKRWNWKTGTSKVDKTPDAKIKKATGC